MWPIQFLFGVVAISDVLGNLLPVTLKEIIANNC